MKQDKSLQRIHHLSKRAKNREGDKKQKILEKIGTHLGVAKKNRQIKDLKQHFGTIDCVEVLEKWTTTMSRRTCLDDRL